MSAQRLAGGVNVYTPALVRMVPIGADGDVLVSPDTSAANRRQLAAALAGGGNVSTLPLDGLPLCRRCAIPLMTWRGIIGCRGCGETGL